MSLEYYTPNPDAPIPREVRLRLVCEGQHDGDLFDQRPEIDVEWPGLGSLGKLTKGWSVAADRRPGPYVLCPGCMAR